MWVCFVCNCIADWLPLFCALTFEHLPIVASELFASFLPQILLYLQVFDSCPRFGFAPLFIRTSFILALLCDFMAIVFLFFVAFAILPISECFYPSKNLFLKRFFILFLHDLIRTYFFIGLSYFWIVLSYFRIVLSYFCIVLSYFWMVYPISEWFYRIS